MLLAHGLPHSEAGAAELSGAAGLRRGAEAQELNQPCPCSPRAAPSPDRLPSAGPAASSLSGGTLACGVEARCILHTLARPPQAGSIVGTR